MNDETKSKNVDELKKIIKGEMVQIIKAKLLSSLESAKSACEQLEVKGNE